MTTLTDIICNLGVGMVIGGALGFGVKHFGNMGNDEFTQFEHTVLSQAKHVINSVVPSGALVAGAVGDVIAHYKGVDQDRFNKKIKNTLRGVGFAVGYGIGYLL
jgi:hypothetical protein